MFQSIVIRQNRKNNFSFKMYMCIISLLIKFSHHKDREINLWISIEHFNNGYKIDII